MSFAMVFTDTRQSSRAGKDPPDLIGQQSSSHFAGRYRPIAPLVEPGLRHAQDAAGQTVRDVVLGPLDTDERGHLGRRPPGHFTRRTMHRLRTSRSVSSSRIGLFFSPVSRRSRSSSVRSLSRIRPVASGAGRSDYAEPFRRQRETQLCSVPG